MIYFDYAANTPPCAEALQTFCNVSRHFIANPNSAHPLGLQAKARLDDATKQIAEILHVKENEIIYTSGASESNNLAIKGVAGRYKNFGRHIITTWMEHSSVNGAVGALKEQGFEVDFVGVNEDGLVDLDELKDLLRDDTILVSVCYVDSESGVKQNIGEIAKVLAGLPHCLLHVDATQAAGKIPLKLENADLITLSPHKFYGLNGCGILIKKEGVMLEPQISGGMSTTDFRSGTPALALIASTAAALKAATEKMDERYQYVSGLNRQLREALSRFHVVRINSTKNSVPFILNVSLTGVSAGQFLDAMGEQGICLSSKSACCAPNTPSRPVYALTKDRKRAMSTLRISLSHLTTQDELDALLKAFDICCSRLTKQGA